MFDTPCKNCIFAIYKETTQTDCDIGKLDNFRKKNVEIIEAYDKDKEFYVIKNRLCTSLRDKKWGDKFNKEDWQKQVEKELCIKYSVIIIANELSTTAEIETTFKNITKQKHLPRKIFIVNLNQSLNRRFLYDHFYSQTRVPLRIEQPIDMTKGANQQIDLLIRTTHIAAPFYLTINAGNILPTDFIEIAERTIFEDLKRFGAITHDNHNIVLYSTPVHVYCNGNKNTTLLDKLKDPKTTINFNEL